MKKMNASYFWISILSSSLCLIIGCSTLNNDRVVAFVDQEPILEKEVNDRIPRGAFENKEKFGRLQRKELSQLVISKLLEKETKKQNVTLADLLAKNVFEQVKPVHKKDIKEYYEKNKNDFRKVSFEEARKMIEDLIYRERKREALTTYYNKLIHEGNVRVLLDES